MTARILGVGLLWLTFCSSSALAAEEEKPEPGLNAATLEGLELRPRPDRRPRRRYRAASRKSQHLVCRRRQRQPLEDCQRRHDLGADFR